MTKKKKLTLIALLSFSVVCVVCIASIYVDNWIKNRLPNAQQIKSTNEPENVAWRFNQALMEDNITLAKELVTVENRERIEQWQRDTQRHNYRCKTDWAWSFKYPFEIQQISWASEGSMRIDDNTIEANSAIGCYSNNYSMKIYKVVVERIKNEWVITNWNKICERPLSDRPDNSTEVCYP